MIVTGFRSLNRVMGQLSYPCERCQQETYHTLVRTRRFFTVFWIQVLPIGKFTTSRCNVCGFQTRVDNNDSDELLPQLLFKE